MWPQFNYLLIIGNLISFAAAVFTACSSASRDRSKIYLLQTWQCILLAVSSIFFQSYAGITTLLLCALRNYLVSKDKMSLKVCILFMITVGVLGFAFNNRGWVGALPVFGTMIYTLWTFYAREERSIKWNISVNLAMWIVYEIFILDISSLVADVICLVITILSLVRLHREKIKKKQIQEISPQEQENNL